VTFDGGYCIFLYLAVGSEISLPFVSRLRGQSQRSIVHVNNIMLTRSIFLFLAGAMDYISHYTEAPMTERVLLIYNFQWE
jgi:hypothetical protein